MPTNLFSRKKGIPTNLSSSHAAIGPTIEQGPIVPEQFDNVVLTGEALDNFKKSRIYKTWTTLSPAFGKVFELGYVDKVCSFPTSVTLKPETPLELFEAFKSECYVENVSKLSP